MREPRRVTVSYSNSHWSRYVALLRTAGAVERILGKIIRSSPGLRPVQIQPRNARPEHPALCFAGNPVRTHPSGFPIHNSQGWNVCGFRSWLLDTGSSRDGGCPA